MHKYLVNSKKEYIPGHKEPLEKPVKKIPQSQSSASNKAQKLVDIKEFDVKDLVDRDNMGKSFSKFFKAGEPIPFFLVTDVFDMISVIKGQNSVDTKRVILTKMFESILHVNPQEIVDVYYFCCLKLDSEWLQKDFGVGNEILMKAISTSCGRTISNLRSDFKKVGDFGALFENSKTGQNTLTTFFGNNKQVTKDKRVSFSYVFEVLKNVAECTGSKSQLDKETLLVNLLRILESHEGKYICRFITKNYNVGAAEKLFQAALARAFCNFFAFNKYDTFDTKPNKFLKQLGPGFDLTLADYKELSLNEKYKVWEDAFTRMITQFPYHRRIFETLLESKSLATALEICKLTPNIPCKPMLAKPTKSLNQIFSRLEDSAFTCEYKYDGLRGQIHFNKEKNDLRIFSRNLEEITEMYPDIAEAIKTTALSAETEVLTENKDREHKTLQSFIIDAEIVAIDKIRNIILPFQILATRSKKNVSLENQQVSVCIFIFDLLYLNGESLLSQTYRTRRDHLHSIISTNYKNNMILLAESKDCQDVNEIQDFLNESVKVGCEGLMVKTLDENSTYEPSKRTFKWLKVKKDYIDNGGIGDSLDLVVMGAIHGRGKRKGKFGGFLVGSYNSDLGLYEACCVVGTGFSDTMLEKAFNELNEYIIDEPPAEYITGKADDIDVWFSPNVVWEVKVADIQISPKYNCAENELNTTANNGKGLGLRFPRFIRERTDKHATDATNSKFIYEIYKQQAIVNNLQDMDDEDYY